MVYRDNGNIDLDESYIVIQDQRGGVGAGFYEVEHDGYTVHHSGRISHTFTFKELMELNGSFARIYNIQKAQQASAINFDAAAMSGGGVSG